MKGQILDYSVQTNSGAISGDDGNRYSFTGDAWRADGVPQRGARVDFDTDGESRVAIDIYSDQAAPQPPAPVVPGHGTQQPPAPIRAGYNPQQGGYGTSAMPGKSKVAAGLLAIFLGGWGIHKFYLGYIGIGVIYPVLNVVLILGACFTFGVAFFLAIPIWLAIGIVSLVEGIIYLTKSDEEFHHAYVVNRRVFF